MTQELLTALGAAPTPVGDGVPDATRSSAPAEEAEGEAPPSAEGFPKDGEDGLPRPLAGPRNDREKATGAAGEILL